MIIGAVLFPVCPGWRCGPAKSGKRGINVGSVDPTRPDRSIRRGNAEICATVCGDFPVPKAGRAGKGRAGTAPRLNARCVFRTKPGTGRPCRSIQAREALGTGRDKGQDRPGARLQASPQGWRGRTGRVGLEPTSIHGFPRIPLPIGVHGPAQGCPIARRLPSPTRNAPVKRGFRRF